MPSTRELTDALGNPWKQHAKEYFRIPPDGNGKVLKKVYDVDGTLIGAKRVDAPDFMKWENGTGPVQVVAKNLRDFLQSSMAWGVPIGELLYVAELLDHLGMYAIAKTGGGAMKQVADKNLEYGWDNVKKIAKLTPNTPGEALGREDCLVSYDKCPPDVAEAYYKALSAYIQTNRAFTGSNNHNDDKNPYKATLAAGMKVQGEITYPVKKMPTEWWVAQAQRKVDRGATSIGIKDGTGRMGPTEAREIISALRKALPKDIRLVMHIQSTVGIAPATDAAGLEAGADAIHVVVGGWAAQRGAFPGLKSMLEIVKGTDREAEYDQVRGKTSKGTNVNVMEEIDREMRRIIEKHPFLLGSNQAVEERTIDSGAPGGGLAAYEVWLRELKDPKGNSIEETGIFDAVLAKQRSVFEVMGWPASITPYYKIGCDQARQNVKSNPHSAALIAHRETWDEVPIAERDSGDWKFLVPQFADVLKGKYGRMPADDDSSLMSEEGAKLRDKLRQRALRDGVGVAIQKATVGKTNPKGIISEQEAASLMQLLDIFVVIGREINALYEPTRKLVEAQDWLSDVQARIAKGVNKEYFEQRLVLAENAVAQAEAGLTPDSITHAEYVSFIKKGTLSDKMKKIVKDKGIEEIPEYLGKFIKEGTYVACAPADALEPRMEAYAKKVKALIDKGVKIGNIRNTEDISRNEGDFVQAVVYAAMYPKSDEGIHLLHAFSLKEKMKGLGILPGEMGEYVTRHGYVEAGSPVHELFKKYDALKRSQILETPMQTKPEKQMQATAKVALLNGDNDKANELANKLIVTVDIRERQEGAIKAGLSETRIRHIVAPLARDLGMARLAEKKLLDTTRGITDPAEKERIKAEAADLQRRQQEIADETRSMLRDKHGFTAAQIEATVRIFNALAKEEMRTHGGRRGPA